MKKVSYLFLLLFIMSAGIFLTAKSTSALSTPSNLKGKILLQVKSKGEAWYISPADGKRYSMGRPADAFNLMRQLGIGISNNNLAKIQLADENLTGQDSDGDGLSDMIEDSIGTDKNKIDSDGDGYNDKEEILSGNNPNGSGKLNLDNNFAKSQAGKILLQVEKHGEAWYVNPNNNQRYFMGRPGDAFNLMRKLGLGISNNDLNKITESNVGQNNNTGCRAFMIDNGNKKCLAYYLPDYAECNTKSDCTTSCQNCVGETQNCVDLGKTSFGINNEVFDYTKYEHYKKCEECNYSVSGSSLGQCKEGYKCVIGNKCEPNFETECKSKTCPNCVSGLEKYTSAQNGFQVCYDCDTNADCTQGHVCSYADCVPASNGDLNIITPDDLKSGTFKYIKNGFPIVVDCGSEGCFENKFVSCEPATMQADSGLFGAAEYKIIGKGMTGCNITFKYTKYPDPSWINKEMTCEFDNKISFQDASTKVFSGVTTGAVVCSGPLYNILSSK